MTGEEYKKARERLGLSQAELGRELGRHQTLIGKREREEKPISTEAEMAIKYLELFRTLGARRGSV